MLEGGCSDRVREATWTMFQVLCSFDFKHHEELLGTLSKYLISLLWRVRKSFGHLFSNIYFHGTVIFFVKALDLSFCETTLLILQNFRIPLLDGKNLFIGRYMSLLKWCLSFIRETKKFLATCHYKMNNYYLAFILFLLKCRKPCYVPL